MSRRLPLPNSLPIALAILIAALAAEVRAQAGSGRGQTGPSARQAGQQPLLKPAPQAAATAAQPGLQEPELFLGQAKVLSKVDKLVITVGEIISYEMRVEIPQGYSAAIPPPGAQLGEFLIRNYEIPQPEQKAGKMIQKFVFKITAYTTGELSIPPVPVMIIKNQKPVRVILSEEIRIRIAPVTSASDMEIKDVKPPLPAPFNYRPLLILAAVLLGLAAIAVSALVIIPGMRRRKIEMPEPLPEPEELAMKELAELAGLGLLEKGEIDLYYTRLSEITRRYLGLRFLIYALEFTTTETMAALKNKWLEHAAYQLIHQFLAECDLVKFAKFRPEPKAQSEIMNQAKKIIKLTRPLPKEEPVPAKATGAR